MAQEARRQREAELERQVRDLEAKLDSSVSADMRAKKVERELTRAQQTADVNRRVSETHPGSFRV